MKNQKKPGIQKTYPNEINGRTEYLTKIVFTSKYIYKCVKKLTRLNKENKETGVLYKIV